MKILKLINNLNKKIIFQIFKMLLNNLWINFRILNQIHKKIFKIKELNLNNQFLKFKKHKLKKQ